LLPPVTRYTRSVNPRSTLHPFGRTAVASPHRLRDNVTHYD
jgi:hypothetical protein